MFGFEPFGGRAFGELATVSSPAPAPIPISGGGGGAGGGYHGKIKRSRFDPRKEPDDRRKRWARALVLAKFDVAKALILMGKQKPDGG
jgi:hypothetical protein